MADLSRATRRLLPGQLSRHKLMHTVPAQETSREPVEDGCRRGRLGRTHFVGTRRTFPGYVAGSARAASNAARRR